MSADAVVVAAVFVVVVVVALQLHFALLCCDELVLRLWEVLYIYIYIYIQINLIDR